MSAAVTHLIVGPDGHGVTEYALALARHAGGAVVRDTGPLPPGPVHVTFTDHLFGPSPDEAVDRVLARCAGHPLSISLHDIPQPEEGAERFARRSPAYRRLAEAADLVAGNSRHEASFFGSPVEVIPLPVPATCGSSPPSAASTCTSPATSPTPISPRRWAGSRCPCARTATTPPPARS